MDSALEVTDRAIGVDALYRADAERLWRAVLAFSADPEIASDAVAEAYAQLIRRGDGVRDGAAWTWRAAFRIAAGSLKQRATPAPRDPSTGYVDSYEDPDLLRALARLPEAQRAAVILHYYADLPVREIASRLGTNGLAVRANLSRGRRRLRELLGDDDV